MRILLFITDKPFPKEAVDLTNLIARLTHSSVTLLHVSASEQDRPSGEEAVARGREMLSGVDVDVHLKEGRPTGGLIEEASEEGYDMIALAMRDISALQRWLGGSRTRKVIRSGQASVLIAKNPRPTLDRMLICTSGAEIAESVVERGAQLAQSAGARVTLLYVASSVPTMYTGLEQIEETLPELLEADTPVSRHLRQGAEILARYNLDAELELRRGVVADEIMEEVERGGYDLIVIGGPRRRGPLQTYLLGDVSWQIVERSDVPVLVVKHGEMVTEMPSEEMST